MSESCRMIFQRQGTSEEGWHEERMVWMSFLHLILSTYIVLPLLHGNEEKQQEHRIHNSQWLLRTN